MKTPWKFLADLVARKPASATDEVPISGEVKAIELKPETESTIQEIAEHESAPPAEIVESKTAAELKSASTIVDAAPETLGEELGDDLEIEARSVDRSDDQGPGFDGEQVPLAGDIEALSSSGGAKNAGSNREPVGSDTEEATVERIVVSDKIGTVSADGAKSKRRNLAKRIGAAQGTAGEADRPEVAQAGVQKNELDEMADLEAEIDALRGLLAQKLILQNAQLRALIRRYD